MCILIHVPVKKKRITFQLYIITNIGIVFSSQYSATCERWSFFLKNIRKLVRKINKTKMLHTNWNRRTFQVTFDSIYSMNWFFSGFSCILIVCALRIATWYICRSHLFTFSSLDVNSCIILWRHARSVMQFILRRK